MNSHARLMVSLPALGALAAAGAMISTVAPRRQAPASRPP